jgi:hypothetical protein
MYCVSIAGDTLLATMNDGISRAHEIQPQLLSERFNMWIPLPIVCYTLPHLVRTDDQVTLVPVSNYLNIYLFSQSVFIQAPPSMVNDMDDGIDSMAPDDICAIDLTDSEYDSVCAHGVGETTSSDIIDLTSDEDICHEGIIDLTRDSESEID